MQQHHSLVPTGLALILLSRIAIPTQQISTDGRPCGGSIAQVSTRPCLSAVVQAGAHAAQLAVDLACWRAQDEAAQGITRHLDVLEAAQYVDLGVRQHDARLGGVFYRVLGLAAL